MEPCSTCVTAGFSDAGARPRNIDAVATTARLQELLAADQIREVRGDVPLGDMLDLAYSDLKYTIVSYLECRQCHRTIFWGLCMRGAPILKYVDPSEVEQWPWDDIPPRDRWARPR